MNPMPMPTMPAAGNVVALMDADPAAAAANQIERPLLARVAESIFWCARYAERSEHLARALLVTGQTAIDAGDLSADLRDRLWLDLLAVFEIPAPPEDGTPLGERVVRSLVGDSSNPSGAVAAVARARENARAVRGEMSSEMWQTLNELYWSLEGDGASAMLAESAEGLFGHLIGGSMRFQGVTDQTLAHGQRWDFAVAGRLLERADATCRIIASRVRLLDQDGPRMEAPLRNIQLMAALRMCCSIEAYRRQHSNELGLRQVAGFLLLRADHPRSVRFAVEGARRAVRRIHRGTGGGFVDPAERLLGRLAAKLEYAEVDEIAAEGTEAFLDDVRRSVAEANAALHRRYFAG